jgi:hypothetical protein
MRRSPHQISSARRCLQDRENRIGGTPADA